MHHVNICNLILNFIGFLGNKQGRYTYTPFTNEETEAERESERKNGRGGGTLLRVTKLVIDRTRVPTLTAFHPRGQIAQPSPTGDPERTAAQLCGCSQGPVIQGWVPDPGGPPVTHLSVQIFRLPAYQRRLTLVIKDNGLDIKTNPEQTPRVRVRRG